MREYIFEKLCKSSEIILDAMKIESTFDVNSVVNFCDKIISNFPPKLLENTMLMRFPEIALNYTSS